MTIHRIHVGRKFEASATGRAAREVTCEQCGESYVYVVTARAIGQRLSPLGLDDAAAAEAAQDKALRDLPRVLRSTVEPIACPACGWYQDDMVDMARRGRIAPGVFVTLAGFSVAMCLLWVGGRDHEPVVVKAAWISAGVGAAGIVLWIARWRWNPNFDDGWKAERRRDEAGRAIRKSEWRDAVHGAGLVPTREESREAPGLQCGGCRREMVAGDAVCDKCGWSWGDGPMRLH